MRSKSILSASIISTKGKASIPDSPENRSSCLSFFNLTAFFIQLLKLDFYNNKMCCLNGGRFLSNLLMSVMFLNGTNVWLIQIEEPDQEI